MGFGKKSEKSEKREKDGDLETKKAGLFNKLKTSKSSTPTPTTSNPYAAVTQSNQNPYANQPVVNDPYAPKSQSSLTQPPNSSFGNLTLNSERGSQATQGRASPVPNRGEKSGVPAGGYGGAAAPRYQSQDSYGQAGGYGGDPYGNGQSRYGAGGYGGMGARDNQDTMSTDVGRSALFGDAPQRAQQQPPATTAEEGGDSSYSNGGGYGSSSTPGGYGAEPDRELTAEEQEEQEVLASKQQIRDIKQKTVASSNNAARAAEESIRIGNESLARLGAQGERIHNTERNLDMASINNRHAEEKARELRTLNRSMWAVHVANPFTKNSRHEERIRDELDKHQAERITKDRTREQAYGSQARQAAQQRDLNGNTIRQTNQKSLADRAKYQFEADSEDDEMENQIDANLTQIHQAVGTLHKLGKAMGEELDSQNRHIDGVITKTDKVDDQIAMNRARLNRIEKH